LKKLCFFFTSKMCSPAMCELSQLPWAVLPSFLVGAIAVMLFHDCSRG
jgi:hypothetical protein